MKISQHQQRSKEARQHTRGIRVLQARKEHGGVAPRRNNITQSANKGSTEAKVKAKAIQESNGKRQDERTKNERKRNKEWDTENDKMERKKNERKKKREKEKEKAKGVWAVLC